MGATMLLHGMQQSISADAKKDNWDKLRGFCRKFKLPFDEGLAIRCSVKVIGSRKVVPVTSNDFVRLLGVYYTALRCGGVAAQAQQAKHLTALAAVAPHGSEPEPVPDWECECEPRTHPVGEGAQQTVDASVKELRRNTPSAATAQKQKDRSRAKPKPAPKRKPVVVVEDPVEEPARNAPPQSPPINSRHHQENLQQQQKQETGGAASYQQQQQQYGQQQQYDDQQQQHSQHSQQNDQRAPLGQGQSVVGYGHQPTPLTTSYSAPVANEYSEHQGPPPPRAEIDQLHDIYDNKNKGRGMSAGGNSNAQQGGGGGGYAAQFRAQRGGQ
jgi:hypothetical protein